MQRAAALGTVGLSGRGSALTSGPTELMIGLGILLGVVYQEVLGLSPGGVIAPAYVAVFYDSPGIIVGLVVVSLVTFLVMRSLTAPLFLYGRRKFALTLVVAFLLRWIWDLAATAAGVVVPAVLGFQIIGFIIPGLIAIDIERQGIARTWIGLLLVAAMVRLVVTSLQ